MQTLPKSIGSRSSIQSILNEALDKNHLTNIKVKKDKRIKNYFLDDNFSIINIWLKKEYVLFC